MRERQNYTYQIDRIFEPQPLFLFMQKHAGLTDYEMYETFNMGMDSAIFLPAKDVKKAQKIIAKNRFKSLDAGSLQKGEKRVVIKPKNLIFEGSTLNVR